MCNTANPSGHPPAGAAAAVKNPDPDTPSPKMARLGSEGPAEAAILMRGVGPRRAPGSNSRRRERHSRRLALSGPTSFPVHRDPAARATVRPDPGDSAAPYVLMSSPCTPPVHRDPAARATARRHGAAPWRPRPVRGRAPAHPNSPEAAGDVVLRRLVVRGREDLRSGVELHELARQTWQIGRASCRERV